MKAANNLAPGAIGILLSVLLLWAGDPWKEKPYSEWSQKDVTRILENSPWAQAVWLESRAEPQLGQDPDPYRLGQPGARDPSVSMKFIVQWASSLTVREALSRERQLQGNATEETPRHLLSEQLEEHVIMVRLGGKTLYEGFNSENAQLELKRAKKKIQSTRVEVAREGPSVVAVLFYFPRRIEEQPVITPEEMRVTFTCAMRMSLEPLDPGRRQYGSIGSRTGPVKIVRTEFDLQKMVRDGQPDL